jgi:predicted nuclease of predicted toxin-antitoxin system
VIGFLLDANLSPETATYLSETLGVDAVRLTGEQARFTDEQVVALAKRESRVIVTFDLDFGEIYHLRERGEIGVIILRLEDQTVESVNRVLARFFARSRGSDELARTLVVLERDRMRIVRPEEG